MKQNQFMWILKSKFVLHLHAIHVHVYQVLKTLSEILPNTSHLAKKKHALSNAQTLQVSCHIQLLQQNCSLTDTYV